MPWESRHGDLSVIGLEPTRNGKEAGGGEGGGGRGGWSYIFAVCRFGFYRYPWTLVLVTYVFWPVQSAVSMACEVLLFEIVVCVWVRRILGICTRGCNHQVSLRGLQEGRGQGLTNETLPENSCKRNRWQLSLPCRIRNMIHSSFV